MAAKRISEHTLVSPTLLPNGLEVSIHSCARSMQRELALVLPGVPVSLGSPEADAADAPGAAAAASPAAAAGGPALGGAAAGGAGARFLVIPTCQRAAMDLVNVGPDVAAEKDALLEKVCRC